MTSGPAYRRTPPPSTKSEPESSIGPTGPRSRPERRIQRVSAWERFVVRLVVGTPGKPGPSRFIQALLLLLLGLSIITGAAMSDVYLHRGVETSSALPVVYQVSGRDLATNIDLRSFDPNQVGSVATTLQENGFRVVRQMFAWSDIESTKGEFVWDRYDPIVSALRSHGIQIVAVLARSPEWARAPGSENALDAPPVDVADYANFVQQITSHFKKDVQFVQLWDLPNLPEYWGGTAATPVAYSDLLANGFNAARTGEPETRIVMAELDPSADGALGADLRFVKTIYALGRSGFFDVVSVRLDGGADSPYDRTVHGDRENFSRAILFRELMVAAGDVDKPIWLTHYGWKRAPAGDLSSEVQADFMLAGLNRARSEWPWMGLMFAWDFTQNGSSSDSAPYALLNDDLTGTPAFQVLSAYGMSSEAILAGTGYVPMDSRPISYQRNWADQHLEGKLFRTTSETTASATLKFRGTGVIAWLRHSNDTGKVRATLDGGPIPGFGGDSTGSLLNLEMFQASDLWITLASGLEDGPHELVLTLETAGELTIGGIVVARDLPLVWPVALLTIAAFILVLAAVRELSYLAATRAGYLQRRLGVELRPPLPHMPDWNPSRRTWR